MRNKRGQFYFVAAIIIILIIAGFIALSNFSKKSSNDEIEILKKELDFEIQKTLEYIAYNNLDYTNSQNILKNFSDSYIYKIGKNKNIIFIFGEAGEELIAKGYKKEDSSNFTISTDLSIINVTNEGEFEEILINSGSEVEINYLGNNYSFEFGEWQSFYYLISKEYKGEKTIIKN